MTNKSYLMIEENTVINIVMWDGNTQTWQPPQSVTMLLQETTPTKIWGLNQDETEYVLVDSIGDATLGFTWDGSVATTNEPKPEFSKPAPAEQQPQTSGTQTL